MSSFAFTPIFDWVASSVIIALVLGITAYSFSNFMQVSSREFTDATRGMWARRWLSIIVVCIMLLGPSTTTTTHTRAIQTTNIFIAVDVTGSMAVRDAQYGDMTSLRRLSAARLAVLDIVTSHHNAQFSAVSFGSTASVDLPITPDSHAVESWADGLKTEPTTSSTGSSLDKPLNTLITAMKNAKASHPQDKIVLYYISDGEQTSSQPIESFSALRAYVDVAVVIGVGSSEGGRIDNTKVGISANDNAAPSSTSTSNSASEWVQDPDTHTDAISRMNADNLANIADQLSGLVLNTAEGKTVSSDTAAMSSTQYRLTTVSYDSERRHIIVWPFAIILGILVLWELCAWMITSRKLLS